MQGVENARLKNEGHEMQELKMRDWKMEHKNVTDCYAYSSTVYTVRKKVKFALLSHVTANMRLCHVGNSASARRASRR